MGDLLDSAIFPLLLEHLGEPKSWIQQDIASIFEEALGFASPSLEYGVTVHALPRTVRDLNPLIRFAERLLEFKGQYASTQSWLSDRLKSSFRIPFASSPSPKTHPDPGPWRESFKFLRSIAKIVVTLLENHLDVFLTGRLPMGALQRALQVLDAPAPPSAWGPSDISSIQKFVTFSGTQSVWKSRIQAIGGTLFEWAVRIFDNDLGR